MTRQVTSIVFRHGTNSATVYPYDEVDCGVFLAEGQVEGIYDAPVSTTYKSGAFQDGSTFKAVKRLQRDITLGFHVRDTADSYEFNESYFRRLFQYELDPWDANGTQTVMEITTTLSGTRKLDVLMYEEPEFKAARDPIQDQYGNLIMKLRAPQPMWYEDDATSTSNGHVTVSNPTDQIMRHEWALPVGTWAVPDVSWTGVAGARAPGGAWSTRTISVTVTSGDGMARISLDRQKLMIRNSAGSNILARLGGQVFAFPIPPYTQSQQLTIGSGAQLIMPRRWSRPWGLSQSESGS